MTEVFAKIKELEKLLTEANQNSQLRFVTGMRKNRYDECFPTYSWLENITADESGVTIWMTEQKMDLEEQDIQYSFQYWFENDRHYIDYLIGEDVVESFRATYPDLWENPNASAEIRKLYWKHIQEYRSDLIPVFHNRYLEQNFSTNTFDV